MRLRRAGMIAAVLLGACLGAAAQTYPKRELIETVSIRRAASDHVAAPPSPAMNSRRLMMSNSQPARSAAYTVRSVQKMAYFSEAEAGPACLLDCPSTPYPVWHPRNVGLLVF
jgi:hypothetical protein